MTVTVERSEREIPPRCLISPKTAALRRLAELRHQCDTFAGQAAAAESRFAALKLRLDPCDPLAVKSNRLNRAEDEVHRLRQTTRNSARIVAEFERGYLQTFNEPAPAAIKVCARCKESKGGDEFGGGPKGPHTHAYCRPCARAASAARYHNNHERIRVVRRERYREKRAGMLASA